MSIYQELEAKGVRFFRRDMGFESSDGYGRNPQWFALDLSHGTQSLVTTDESEEANARGRSLSERWRARRRKAAKSPRALEPRRQAASREPWKDKGFASTGPVYLDWAHMSHTEYESARNDLRRTR